MARLQALVSRVSLLRLLVYLSGLLQIRKCPCHSFTIFSAFFEGVLGFLLPQPDTATSTGSGTDQVAPLRPTGTLELYPGNKVSREFQQHW